jgi:hypothetical protein
MTVVAPATAPAQAARSVAPVPHASGAGGHAFSAALDALMASDGKARSTNDGSKPAADEAPEPESARPPSDLRAALIGGALASLAVQQAGDAGPTAADDDAGGDETPSARSTGNTESPPPANSAAQATKAPSGARLTAERAFVAPAAVSGVAHGAALAAGSVAGATADTSSGAAGTAQASASEAAPTDAAATQSHLSSAAAPWIEPTEINDPSNAVIPAQDRGPPSAIEPRRGQAEPTKSAASSEATTSSAAVGVKSGSTPAAPAAASSRRTPPSSRETGAARTDAPHRAARAASSGSPSHPATGGGGPAPDVGPSGGQGQVAPSGDAATVAQANSASPRAETARTETAPAPSQASATVGSGWRKTSPTVTAQAAGRVREIDVDLAPGGLEDVTMTVRLADDKLGVVIRAASGATTTAIEGARDAIAERLAAIGQPLSFLTIQQAGGNDATGTAGQSTGDGDAPRGQAGDFGGQRNARRDPSRS